MKSTVSMPLVALAVAATMVVLAVPTLAMRFEEENARDADGAHHLDDASKNQLWKKVDEAAIQYASATNVGGAIVANATAHIGSTLFNKIGALVSAAVNQYGKSVVIPGESTKHFSFSDIHFSAFDIQSIDFTFMAPNKIRFSIRNLNIVVPETLFHVYAKVLFVKVSCHGHFKASITGTSMDVDLTLATNPTTKHLTVTSATSSVNFGHLSISHKLSNLLCKVGQSVIQLLIGNIDKKITQAIKDTVPKAVGPMTQQLLTTLLAKLPLEITSQPVINSAGIDVTAVMLRYPKASSSSSLVSTSANSNNLLRMTKPAKGSLHQLVNYPVLPATTTTAFTVATNAVGGTTSDRDINLIISEESINNAIHIFNLEGKIELKTKSTTTTDIFKLLIPAAYARCPNCTLDFDTTTPEFPPSVDLKHDKNITVAGRNMHIDVFGVATNDTTHANRIPLFGLSMNGTVQVINLRTTGSSGSTLMFNLGIPIFSIKLRTSPIGPIPLVPALDGLLRGLIQSVVVPSFNSLFPGLQFPPALIQHVLVQISLDTANVGMDIVLQ